MQLKHAGSWHGLVGIATRLAGQPRNQGLIPGKGKIFFFSLNHSDQLWDSTSLLFDKYWGLLPRGKADYSPPSNAKVKNGLLQKS